MNTLIIYKAIGVLGLVCICISMLVKHRTTRDIGAICGGILLLVYSIYLNDLIFIILQGVYILITLFDFINKKFIQHKRD